VTVSELIEWLKTQDQEAIVQVLVRSQFGDYCSEEDFDIPFSEYTDFRGNQFVKPEHEYFNKRYLLLGST
jgi:hypothetical protein